MDKEKPCGSQLFPNRTTLDSFRVRIGDVVVNLLLERLRAAVSIGNRCRTCGLALREGVKICTKCGASVVRKWPILAYLQPSTTVGLEAPPVIMTIRSSVVS